MKKMTTLRFIAFWLCMLPLFCTAQDRYNDSLALVALYNSTNGTNWINTWNLTQAMDAWYGVNLNESGRIDFLDLSSNELSGNIPTDIGNLTDLEVLDLYSNQLTGNIPSEIGNLTNLVRLWMSDNQLSGNIPPEIENMTSLITVILSGNQLSGEIPVEITNLAAHHLTYLSLGRNQLSGNIPPEFGNMTNLISLSMGNNQLTGNIPPEIGNMTNLEGISLSGNQLSGSIPLEIGNLTNLIDLYLVDCGLSGSIPVEIENLVNLRAIFAQNNQFTGSIPTSIGNLTNLQALYLFNNEITGNIPTSIGNLTNLKELRVGNNQLSGNLPESIGNIDSLRVLSLTSNELTGSIPVSIGNLSKLTALGLANNELTGSIPVSIENLSKLTTLSLANNELTGSITSELGNMTNLTEIDLSTNQLSGSIPSNIGNLTDLKYLILYHNELSGSIPAEVSNLINLKWLWIGGNELTDTIPNLENLTQLERLDLAYNDLSGDFPNLGSYNLKILQLQNNKITGNIPTIFSNLNNLTYFHIGNNRVSGDIPIFSNSSSLTTLHIDKNKFSFDAIEATYNSNNFVSNFKYSPQYYGNIQSYIVKPDTSLTLELLHPFQSNNNNQYVSYQWKKNDFELVGSTDSTFIINDLQISNVGKYTLHMTDSSRIPDLEIISEPIYVVVPRYDLYGQPVVYNQIIIEFDNEAEKIEYEQKYVYPTERPDLAARIAGSCDCNRLLYLWDFPNDSIALEVFLEINTKRESIDTRKTKVDGGFNNIFNIGPIASGEGWSWSGNYSASYHDSVVVFLLDSGVDTINWDASPYLFDAAPIDSCYDTLISSGFDYTDSLGIISGDFTDSLGHGTYGFRSIAEGLNDYLNLKVVPLKIFDKKGQGTLFDFVCALYHAIDHDADIIHVSAGYAGQASNILENAVALSKEKGCLLVTAAGNNGTNIDTIPQYPAYYAKEFYKEGYDGRDSLVHYNNVISVASIGPQDELSSFSNYGDSTVVLSAYGENMSGYSHTGEKVSSSGSSVSAFYVTRELVVEIAKDKNRTYEQIWQDFENNRLDDCPTTDSLTKTGKCLDISLNEVYANLRVYLEGAYQTTEQEMRNDLNMRQVLPGQIRGDSTLNHDLAVQPYSNIPPYYQGNETVPDSFDNYPDEVVDWILVSLRTEANADTVLSRTAAWLLDNGNIQLLQPLLDSIHTAPDSVFIVIEHRNHLLTMSPQKIPIENIITWDFTTQDGYGASTGVGQKELEPSVWTMFAGDGQQDGDINGEDKTIWYNDNGNFYIYMLGDYNLNGDINGEDKIIWQNNNGRFSGVPK